MPLFRLGGLAALGKGGVHKCRQPVGFRTIKVAVVRAKGQFAFRIFQQRPEPTKGYDTTLIQPFVEFGYPFVDYFDGFFEAEWVTFHEGLDQDAVVEGQPTIERDFLTFGVKNLTGFVYTTIGVMEDKTTNAGHNHAVVLGQ
jgi:hypothetical protein